MAESDADPVLGNWYRHLDKGYEFQVVAVDDLGGVVEIQHYDGDVEELDMDEWYRLEVVPIEAPEEWSGPIDDLEHDDMGYSETDMAEEDWDTQLGEWHEEGGEPGLEVEEPEEVPAREEGEEKE